MIYLDNAATSWPKPEGVSEAVKERLAEYGANPGRGGHRLSEQAGRQVEETRRLLAQWFHISQPKNLIFCQNGTHAINLALKGWLREGDHVVTTCWEHHAVIRPLNEMKRSLGVKVEYIPPGPDGPVDLSRLKEAIQPHTRLLVSTHASNVNGVLLPLEEMGAIAGEKGVPFLVDAAQTAGVVPVDVQSMGISMLAFPGHKGLFGPQGTGGLYLNPELPVRPIMQGGTGNHSEDLHQPEERPLGFESGTLNTPGIAGLGAGVRFLMDKGWQAIHQHETELSQQLVEGLKRMEKVHLYQLPFASVAVVSFRMEGIDETELATLLDRHFDIAVRAGYHCAALAHQTMGTKPGGTLRVSPGYFNTQSEVDIFLEALQEVQQAFAGL